MAHPSIARCGTGALPPLGEQQILADETYAAMTGDNLTGEFTGSPACGTGRCTNSCQASGAVGFEIWDFGRTVSRSAQCPGSAMRGAL